MSKKIESILITAFQADKPNSNGRTYSKECMSKMVEMINEKATQDKMWVASNIPEDVSNTQPYDVCMRVKNATLEGDKIKIDVKYVQNPLLTEDGIITLLKSDKFQVIPRCLGELDKKHNVTVQDVYGFSICAKEPAVPYNYKEPNE